MLEEETQLPKEEKGKPNSQIETVRELQAENADVVCDGI